MSVAKLLSRCRFVVARVTAGLFIFAPSATFAVNGIAWDSITLTSTAPAGSNLAITASVRNTGDTTWGSDYRLELKDAAGSILRTPTITGIPPGGSTSVVFYATLPTAVGVTQNYGFTARRSGVEYFGETQWRDVTTSAPANSQPNYSGPVWLSSYRFMEAFRPMIDTSWSPTPYYRLRAKFPDPANGLGFHAATTLNNKGFELDALPPPGTYNGVDVYWVSYDSANFTNPVVGPGNQKTVVITEPSVALSTYWFSSNAPPTVTVNQNRPKNYKLVARVRQTGERLTTSWNNDTRYLDRIPGPGTYDLELF